MAVVKNRLKVFETDPDQETMAGTRPQTPLKPSIFGQNMSPALQKFMNKQNEVIGADVQVSPPTNTEASVKKAPKVPSKATGSGVGLGSAAEQDENNIPATSVNKSSIIRPAGGAAKPTDNRRGSQVVVPNIFKQESVNETALSDSRRGSQVNVPEVFKHNLKTTSSEANTTDDNKPKPTVKPGSSYPRPPAGPKPLASGGLKPPLPGSSAQTSQSVGKKPSDVTPEDKPQHILPRDSTRVKLPAMDHISLKPTHSGTTSSSSPSQLASSEVKATDFRNILKSAKAESVNQSGAKLKPAGMKPLLPPTGAVGGRITETQPTSQPDKSAVSNSTHIQPVHHAHSAAEVSGSQTEPGGNKWKVGTQELKRQSRSPVLERKHDSKKFKKVKFEAVVAAASPSTKPALPDNMDLALVTQQYHQILGEASNTSGSGNVADSDGDVYDDGTSVADVVRRETTTKRQSTCVSMIPDMSAEEEQQELYDDGLTPAFPPPPPEADGLYVDAETERKDDGELYEDEETFALNAEQLYEDQKRKQKEEAEAKKREEKERKEREKEEEKKRKKEEKERAKKEKEEMQLRKKFNLTGEEIVAGEGIIKQDVKGGVLGGLSLKKGQTVTIVRLDNNPPNKWLIKSDAGMGYIDSSNIEVDPNIIRQIMLNSVVESACSQEQSAMTGQARGTRSWKDDGEDQPLYDDVPSDVHSHDLQDDEEIYEECP